MAVSRCELPAVASSCSPRPAQPVHADRGVGAARELAIARGLSRLGGRSRPKQMSMPRHVLRRPNNFHSMRFRSSLDVRLNFGGLLFLQLSVPLGGFVGFA